jgi:hypothetical protein
VSFSVEDIERTPLQSKKFIAFFLCLVLSRIALVVMIKGNVSDVVLITALLSATFVDVGYILGQAALDIYVRGIAEIRHAGRKEDDKPPQVL